MDFSKIRGWTGSRHEVLFTDVVGLDKSQLLDSDFRRRYKLTLPTSCRDKFGIEMYEGDVLRIYYPSFSTLREEIAIGSDKLPVYGYIGYYPAMGNFALWTNYSQSLINLKPDNPTWEIIDDFYANPSWLSLTGSLSEASRWKTQAE